MRALWVLAVLVVAVTPSAAQVTVNCDRGDSLAAALSALPRDKPTTVFVRGTCTEYVDIDGFEGLTLRGAAAAVLRQPAVASPSALIVAPLTVTASRSVTIRGLTIQASVSDPNSWGVYVRGGSADVRLRAVTVEGGSIGIGVAEGSQVSLAGVTARDPGWATAGVFDGCVAHIEDSLFESTTGEGWHEGVVAMKGTIALHGTRIRNMQVGIHAFAGGIVDIVNFSDYFPRESGPSDVVVQSEAGVNFQGVAVSGSASVHVDDARLRIIRPGQDWGGDTGGVSVTDGSTFSAAANSRGAALEIQNSQGQGVFVANNSFADIAGASISGTTHGGLVVVNNSTADLDSADAPFTQVDGAPDLFCDSTSLITGASKAIFDSKQCGRLLGPPSVPLP
jgi:hypothetical protein